MLPALLGARTLGIKEASHPKHIRPPFKYPSGELCVSFQKFGKPEAQRGRIPGHPFPELRDTRVVHVVQGVSQVLRKARVRYVSEQQQQKREVAAELREAHLTHDDCALNGQLQIAQATAKD